MPLLNLIYADWHIWQSPTSGEILVSDERIKKLRAFRNPDDAINFLYLGAKDRSAARALHRAVKDMRQGKAILKGAKA